MSIVYDNHGKAVPSPGCPIITDDLRRFFDSEVENFCTAVRQGDIDCTHGEHPTLGWVFDSLQQAPEDVIFRWLGAEDEDNPWEHVASQYFAFVSLVLTYGDKAPVVDFLPD